MNELTFNNIGIALAGGVLGFLLKWFLAERKERYEFRRSIAPQRVEAYRSLWELCRKKLPPNQRAAKAEALWSWYNSGGGLFLSLAASKRFFSAAKLMEQEGLSDEDAATMHEHLTWIRTEMKYHVGSYTWWDKKTQIPVAVDEPPKKPIDNSP
jgi:hypothetical protein